MAIIKFLDWKRAVFRCGRDIKDLRGDVHRYAAQVSLPIDAATAEKTRLRRAPTNMGLLRVIEPSLFPQGDRAGGGQETVCA